MQNDIIAKIDSLVKMSETTANAGTLNVELRELEVQIKEKKLDLKELKSSITDDKYFDVTSEIVDKNIEISLNKKIKYLNKSLAELTSKVNEVSKDEENKYKELESLKKNIKDSEEFIDILKTKISSANESEKSDFEKLLDETETKLKDNKKELTKLNKAYEKVQGKLEALSYSKAELEKKLEEDTEKLIDVKSNLLNKRGYVNTELKQEDQEKIDELENQIAELEKQKTEILNDPVMIAEEAKNYLIDDDKTGALKKIDQLKKLIEEQPYMDINLSTNGNALDIELENTEAKRDEFASMISSKNYESVDTTLIKDRIEYIKDKKERLLGEIEQIREKIKRYDEDILEDLNNRINYCENEARNLKAKISEYEETLKDENITPSKKASLQASFDKKQEEYDNVEKLLEDYKEDRRITILTSYELETKDISDINKEINEIDEEIKKLEKLIVSSNKTKDLIAIENDKKTLKELNDTIKAIKKRKSIKSSPSEIYDEIELLLGTGYVETSEEEINYDNEEQSPVLENDMNVIDNLDDFTINENVDKVDVNELPQVEIEPLEENKVEQEPVVEDIPEAPAFDIDSIVPLEDINVIDNIDTVPVDAPVMEQPEEEKVEDIPQVEPEVTTSVEELPIIDSEELNVDVEDINNNEKIKVINIEPLDSTEEAKPEETNDNSEFLIGDYNPEG